MDDEFIVGQVREMQEMYEEYKALTADIRVNEPDSYRKLLGLD
jgi:hypothetical protein